VWRHLCEVASKRITQLPRSEDCNRRMASAKRGIEEQTGEWMRGPQAACPNTIAPADRKLLSKLTCRHSKLGTRPASAKELKRHFPLIMPGVSTLVRVDLSARSALPLCQDCSTLLIH